MSEEMRAILIKKLDELEALAANGGSFNGQIPETFVTATCSPGKIICVFPFTNAPNFAEDLMLERGYVKGKHYGKRVGQHRLRQLVKFLKD